MVLYEIRSAAQDLWSQFQKILPVLHFDEKVSEQRSLEQSMSEPGFWDDASRAQKVSQRVSRLTLFLDTWKSLQQEISDFVEMSESACETDIFDLEKFFLELQKKFSSAENALLLAGEYDSLGAIVSLHVGNGGQDAEDFTQMLLRMYLRFCEKKDWNVSFLEESRSDVGLKSVTFQVPAEMAYGFLKSEHGVHRLIRLSPFNAKSLRQTSFARVEVLPLVQENISFQIDDKDLRIDVFRSGGSGGQSVNTTDSAVRITYLPLNLVAVCQNERSQFQNKEAAMRVLQSRLLQLQLEQKAQKISELRGDLMENSFGSQIRTHTLQPYKLVKDHRTQTEHTNPDAVFDGDIDVFVDAFLRFRSVE